MSDRRTHASRVKDGQRAAATARQRHGDEFHSTIGKKGGEVTAMRHGSRFYEEIGRKGGQKVKQLIEQGKQAAEQND